MAELATLEREPALPPGVTQLTPALRLAVLAPATQLQLQLLPPPVPAGAIPALVMGGTALPAAMNRWTGADPVICHCAPDTWLLQSGSAAPAELERALRAVLADRPAALTDLSDALVRLALDGADAAALLGRGCGLDLAPAAFPDDGCARTRLAQLPVLVRCTAGRGFELTVEAALAAWLHDWLADAALGLDRRSHPA